MFALLSVSLLWICSVLQVDFILGREIEIGGIYKGTVASVKEYGAFVEFNGGQQGLLHISELSHEPVCSRNALLYSTDSLIWMRHWHLECNSA